MFTSSGSVNMYCDVTKPNVKQFISFFHLSFSHGRRETQLQSMKGSFKHLKLGETSI